MTGSAAFCSPSAASRSSRKSLRLSIWIGGGSGMCSASHGWALQVVLSGGGDTFFATEAQRASLVDRADDICPETANRELLLRTSSPVIRSVALLLPSDDGDDPAKGATQPCRRGAAPRRVRRAVHDHRLWASRRRARPRARTSVGVQHPAGRPVGDATGSHA